MPGKTKKQLADMASTVTGVGWGDTNQACVYANITMPTLRAWREDGLRSSKVGCCVRIKYSDIDEYLGTKQVGGDMDVDMERINKIALEAVAGL